jgi:L-lactate permease
MAPDAPAPAPSRTPLYITLGTGALFAAALTYIGLADPHRPGFLAPPCPFKFVTGWDCPACGGLRMTHDLLHGDIAAAVADNVFLLVGLPLLGIWVLTRWRRHQPVMPPAAIVTVAVAAISWTVARNLPGFPLVPTLLGG